MFRSLYARLSLALVALLLIIGVLYSVIILFYTERHLQETTQLFNRDLAERIVSDRDLITDGRLDADAVKQTFSAYMDINPSIEIYLLDKQGRILAFSADPGKVKRQQVDLAPIDAFLRGEHFPLLGDDPRSHDRLKAFSVTRVPGGDMPAGYLYVVLRGEQYESAEKAVQDSYILGISVWAGVISLGFGLLAGLILFHLLTRRLRRLGTSIEGFQKSDFTIAPEQHLDREQVSDELDQLSVAFQDMADRIVEQWGELKKQDRLRRDLVAQISHDLRTPLAVLHGYLETLQIKQVSLDSSEATEYLGTALKQSGRLKTMVEELFELARLEARDTAPVLEPVSIPELIQDVIQKFRVVADKAGLSISMSPPEGMSLVLADVALTERVLDNLIANAIEHTPEGGAVDITCTSSEKEVIVSVCDTGAGVPEDEISSLFTPFYRGSSSAEDREHAGLGLAIAERIVRMQGGDITAENRPQGGSRFFFTLKRAG